MARILCCAAAHAVLDAAVLAAYGFSARKDLLGQLLALNLEVAAKIERGDPVTVPGVPPGFADPESLVTGDCIVPPGEYAETIPHPDSTPESEALAEHFYFTKEEGPPYRTK